MIIQNGIGITSLLNGETIKQTLDPANETVGRGIYVATTLSGVDADLATANIKNGITVFGFAGDADVHDISDATAIEAEVIVGETFYAVGGGIRVGTMPIVALAPGSNAYPEGYHAGNVGGLDAVDVDLVTANIKNGVTIFNVAGSVDVRDVSDADAVVGEVKTGSTFYAVGGARKVGTGTQTLNPANENVPAGYYALTTLSAVDVSLAVGNIKLGVNIFGFVGTFAGGALAEDTVDSQIETDDAGSDQGGSYYVKGTVIISGTDYDLVAVTDTFAAGSMAVGSGWSYLWGPPVGMFKARLYMGGVQVAETGWLVKTNFVIVATRALTGVQEILIAIHNYDGSSQTCNQVGYRSSTENAAGGVAVGSIV